MIDVRQLRSFVTVCEEGGFGLAALRLNKTQPAVSYDIRLLEQAVGVALFERRRPLLLTGSGRHLLLFGRRYLAEQDRVLAELRGGGYPEEPARILSVSGFGRYVVFPALREAAKRGHRYVLGYPTAAEVFQAVEAGECDLGFVYLPKVSSNLTCRCIGYEELSLFAPARWKLPAAPASRVSWIAAQAFITYEECDYVFGQWFQSVIGTQPASLHTAWHFEELEEVVTMVEDGRGISILPSHVAAAAVRQKRVKEVQVGGRRCSNPVFAVTRAGAEAPPWLAELANSLGDRPGMTTTGATETRRTGRGSMPRSRTHATDKAR